MGLFNRGTRIYSSGNGNTQVISTSGGETTVTVNGKTMRVKGNNISVINGKVIVDGKELTEEDAKAEPGTFSSITKLVIEGNAERVDCACGVEVKGDVFGDVDAGTSARVDGSVKGNVDAGTSVTVGGSVMGSIDAGLNVTVKQKN